MHRSPAHRAPRTSWPLAKARNLASIEIGRGIVELAARPGFAFDDDLPVDIGGSDLPTFDSSGSFDFPSTPVVGGARPRSGDHARAHHHHRRQPASRRAPASAP